MAHHGRYIFDAHGDPQPSTDDYLTWARWLGTPEHHQLAETTFRDVRVSTVFLGVSFRTPPILWESMVFGGALDGQCHRYFTRAEADAGHTALCVAVVEALGSLPAPDAVDPQAGSTGPTTPRA